MNETIGHQIIKNNIKVLYHIDKYAYLKTALKSDKRLAIEPKKLLYNILNFLKDKELIYDKNNDKWCFFLTTDTITELRKKDKYEKIEYMHQQFLSRNKATSNHYINYLSALGVINKMYQPFYMSYADILQLTEINRRFLLNNLEKSIPINFFYIEPYTKNKLEEMEERAKRILQAKLTPGKAWSKATLQARNLGDIAEELYRRNNDVIAYKTDVFDYMCYVIDRCIEIKGYARKEDLSNNMLVDDKTIENIRMVFKPRLSDKYYYKRATKQQRENYGINDNKFIFTVKENK